MLKLQGAKRAWPAGGEIDILEGVNSVAGNTYTLHTTAGCTMSGQSSSSSLALTQDCQYQPGCSYKDRNDNSYGPVRELPLRCTLRGGTDRVNLQGFNAAGGGFYASFMDDSGIKVCRSYYVERDCPRSNVPIYSIDLVLGRQRCACKHQERLA